MSEEKTKTYFEERVQDELGVTADLNKIRLKGGNNQDYELPVFSEDEKGNIKIIVYSLDRKAIEYDNPKATPERPNINNDRPLPFYITRLKEPETGTDGKIRKYNIPKGAGTYPFFPPSLVEKFESKAEIKTLVLTEGYFKAFKGAMHGLDVVGLSSITHYKAKETQQMYFDVHRIIRECGVENIIILYDGDCQGYSEKAFLNGEDLYKRPSGFFNSAKSIRELLKDYEKLSIYFAHVISDSCPENPKGLDDILVTCRGKEQEVIDDILTYGRPGKYVYKENITYSLVKIQRYLHINSAQDFYAFHADNIQHREFVFNGTHYQWNDEKNELEVLRRKEAKDYFRVGDNYYELLSIPNKYGQLEKVFQKRKKETITDDFGRSFLKQVAKYKAFYVQPDHVNFQQVSYNCYNMYARFEHVPELGSCNVTLEFLKHIFGPFFEFGLDYIQLLYQRPTQKLPILCLVSVQNKTGKTTFSYWLKAIFTSNMCVVGNSDLANDFNSHYVSRLIICIDESLIDRRPVIEKIKSLSTADKITMNAKGRDQVEVDFFGKFIMLSNHEDNFIYATNEDIRYWIIKVPVPKVENVNLLNQMIDEIPAFLDFLNKRKMFVPECQTRMWFRPEDLMTDALKRVIENSRPAIEKEIYTKVRELFLEFGDEELLLTPKVMNERLLIKRVDESYLNKILQVNFKVDYYRNSEGKIILKRFKFPVWGTGIQDNKEIDQRQDIDYVGRPFVFKRENFLSEEEIRELNTDYMNKDDDPF